MSIGHILVTLALCLVGLAFAGALSERTHKIRKAEVEEAKNEAADLDALVRGIELTARQNRDLGQGAEVVADLIESKIDHYRQAKLKREVGVEEEAENDA